MPLNWDHGTNPYVYNYFGKLQVGPNTEARIFQARAKSICQKLAANDRIELGGRRLDEYVVNEASKKLLEPGIRAEEMLLAHPQGQKENSNLRTFAEQLRTSAVLPDYAGYPRPAHDSALFWLLPAPGGEAVGLPDFNSLNVVKAGDPDDLALDIVYDR